MHFFNQKVRPVCLGAGLFGMSVGEPISSIVVLSCMASYGLSAADKRWNLSGSEQSRSGSVVARPRELTPPATRPSVRRVSSIRPRGI